MVKRVTVEEIFSDLTEEELEDVGLYYLEDIEGVENEDETIDYNSGWYNYITKTIDYKGKRYNFEYKEHTSDNVSDREIDYDSLICLGEVKDMDKTYTQEEVSQMMFASTQRNENLSKEREELLLELRENKRLIKEVRSLVRRVSAKQFNYLGDLFEMDEKDREEMVEDQIKMWDRWIKMFKGFAQLKEENKL